MLSPRVVCSGLDAQKFGKGNRQNGVCAQVGFVGFAPVLLFFFGFAGSPVPRSIVRSVKLKPYTENFAKGPFQRKAVKHRLPKRSP